MRKNKSVNEVTQSRSRPSQGKEISIQLHPPSAKDKQNAKCARQQSKQLTDRSLNWQHPSISENILKDILNYKNISQSELKSNKNSNTVAVYERHQDIMSQFAKINKKAFPVEYPKKGQKLVLDHSIPMPFPNISIDTPQQQKSIAMVQSIFFGTDYSGPARNRELFSIQSINSLAQKELEIQLHHLAASLDELNIIEQSITREYSELIPQWQSMMKIQYQMHQVQQKLTQYDANINSFQVELAISNDELLNASKELITSRKLWNERGSGGRTKVLDEAIHTHEQFVKKITIRDFEETLLFNMKVAIPQHQGKNSLKGIYLELFSSKSTKKFTMILKKHAAHMDLYDAKLLNDFVKNINDLDTQYCRCQGQNIPHPDLDLLNNLQQSVRAVQQTKFHLNSSQNERNQIKKELNQWQLQWKSHEQKVLKVIEEVNLEVRGQYERYAEKAADFKALLINRYTNKYNELKAIREKKRRVLQESEKLRIKLVSLK